MAAQRQQREETKRQRVELDDQEKVQIGRFIIEAQRKRSGDQISHVP
ncbi:hypothetical protein [Paenibacillus ihumii]|nr:hypothetical protein [Paenibacillus ihumii]